MCLVTRWKRQAVVLGLMVACAIALQVQVSNGYRLIWRDQLAFYWQMTWRAPSLQPGTSIVMEDEPFPNQGLFSTSSAINLLYPQPAGARQLAYYIYALQPRFTEYSVEQFLAVHLHTQFRTLIFEGSGSQAILVDNDPDRGHCTWVLSPVDEGDPRLPKAASSFLPISKLDLIGSQPIGGASPAEVLFGKEPAHGWCYYYEKADLARQLGDWAEAARLGDEAQAKGFTPANPNADSPHEWMPFIEAYIRIGEFQQAKELTAAAFKTDGEYQPVLCKLWTKVVGESSAGSQGKSEQGDVYSALNCPAAN